MKSRAERAAEAEEAAFEAIDILWALALNDAPQRRGYIAYLSGADDKVVLRTLARLANASSLASTDGLEFALADDDLAEELRPKVPAAKRAEMHRKSLEYAAARAETSPAFVLHHTLGAGDFTAAATLAVALLEKTETASRAPLLAKAKQCLTGLWAVDGADQALVERLGTAILRHGEPTFRPREFKEWVERLRALPLADESRAVVDAAVQARAQRKEEAKAEAQH